MTRPITRDPLFLAMRSESADEADRQYIYNLIDTLHLPGSL